MRSDEKALRNELTFRAANERIREARERLPRAGEPVPFLCECENAECTTIMRVPLETYTAARSEPDRFLLVTGHPHRGVVLATHEGFVVVRKDMT